MIRAQEGILDFAAIRQINWDVHLGDLVTARGVLQQKNEDQGHHGGWLFVLHSIEVDELWSLHHDGTVFSYTQSSIADSTEDGSTTVKGSWVLPPSSKASSANKYTNMVVLNGFNTCKYYFSSSGGANCLRGEQCHFWHGRPEDFQENRRRWMAKRLERRAKAAHLAGDSGDPHSKIDKAQRSRIFCDWLVESLGVERLSGGTGVVDVAGGKGDIPIQLWIQRGIPTTLIDPRPMKLGKYNRKLVAKAESIEGRKMSPQLLRCLDQETMKLHTELFSDCSVLVGMHPDEATEAIVDAALALGKPFAIVPCCVMSRVFPDRQCQDGTLVDTYEKFVKYLLEKHPSVQNAFLPFAGRNQVLYLFDYNKEKRDVNCESTST
ncbi:Zinc finger-containing protein [Phytophthora palmivora]|uniref:Zinc finger-containing protein n=1 Tax=Phytophthora palmivora TaxID=4796 RepID=A0A2P4WZR3_9STRA|nr:Zinc finger-containing protein [Phytophthora palmivora]